MTDYTDLARRLRERKKRQYYYRVIGCCADYPTDPGCICWHDEGTGPLPNGTAKQWREKPAAQPQEQREPTEAQIVAAAKELCRCHAEGCGVDPDDEWKLYCEQFRTEAARVLRAALAAKE